MSSSDNQAVAQCRSVLLLLMELHLRGFQRLRLLPGMAPSGMYWRCAIAPVSLVSRSHGARLSEGAGGSRLVATYSGGQEDEYFGWTDAKHATPSGLARRFVERFPDLVAAGRGSDWSYSGWYVDLLHLTYPNRVPYAYSDWDVPDDHLPTVTIGSPDDGCRIPLPPPGEAGT